MLRAFDTVFGHYFRLSFTTQRRNGLQIRVTCKDALFIVEISVFIVHYFPQGRCFMHGNVTHSV